MATHSDPYPIFLAPVKDVIAATLYSLNLFDAMTVLKHDSIERDGSHGASIVVSKQIVPVVNRTEEKPRGGRTQMTYLDVDGNTWERVFRSTLIVHFDVAIWFPDMARSVEALFGLVGQLPRATVDGHLPKAVLPEPLVSSNGEAWGGNPIELECISPQLPEERTSTARTYRSSVIVRATGGIYHDSIRRVQVTPKTRLAPDFAP